MIERQKNTGYSDQTEKERQRLIKQYGHANIYHTDDEVLLEFDEVCYWPIPQLLVENEDGSATADIVMAARFMPVRKFSLGTEEDGIISELEVKAVYGRYGKSEFCIEFEDDGFFLTDSFADFSDFLSQAKIMG